MSLGYNTQKPLRTTNLPGSVGNTHIVRRNPPPRSTQSLPRLPPRAERKPVAAWAEKRGAASTPSGETARVVGGSGPTEENDAHWVYGTAVRDLLEEGVDDGIVATKGERVLLLYPQRHDADTGRVLMRAKIAHSKTGQLRHAWVEVYAGVDDDTRNVDDFSLVP